MRCLTCQKLSLPIICKDCQTTLLTPNLTKRILEDDFIIFSFYSYEEIKELINSKYQLYGDLVYKILCENSLKKFADEFQYSNEVYVTPVDDYPIHGFSQSAVIAKSMKSKTFKPQYGKLRAKNRVKYAGKSLEFRKNNPREFTYNGKKKIQTVIVDDIITTGSTILEAKKVLEQNRCEVLFALTLCDAKI